MNTKIRNKTLRYIIRIFILLFVIVPILVIAFISPITKYLVEKYDVKYTGREIKMDWAYVNPFTGYVHFSNFKVYESKSDSTFLTATGVSANFTVNKLFSKTYEISELELDNLNGIIIQTKKQLNLDDIIELFAPKEKQPTNKPPVNSASSQ